MIRQGNKNNAEIVQEGTYDEMKDLYVKAGQIVEFEYQLNWLGRTFSDKTLEMQREEFNKNENLDLIYYEYNPDTGKALYQLKVVESNTDNSNSNYTTAGGTLIVISIVAISAVLVTYMLTEAEKVRIRNPISAITTDILSTKTLVIIGAGAILFKLYQEGILQKWLAQD